MREASLTAKAINDNFLHDHHYGNGTVTANLLPLAMDIVPQDERRAVEDSLIATIVGKNNSHIACGLIGVQWLMRYLARHGHGALAWQLATQRSYPSWGYMVDRGATTIWELWNGDTANPEMNSENHVMLFGDLLIWAFEDLGGIRPLQPGFRKVELHPDFSFKKMKGVSCAHRSPYGIIRSSWKRKGSKITWDIEIPANTTAILHMPDGSRKNVGSGTYRFEYFGAQVRQGV